MENAFEELKRVGGIESEKDYPYKGAAQKECKLEKSKV